MKILVVGSGGREHAILWRLSKDPERHELFAAPGNAGTATIATSVMIKVDAIEEIAAWAKANAMDLVVVGPEAPLVAGLVDALERVGIAAFGPVAAGAKMEGSKRFAKEIMDAAGVPTGKAETFSDAAKAKAALGDYGLPVVIKADGLAAGKGVVVAETTAQAEAAIDDMLVANKFGAAGAEVLIEEFLHGEECSILAMVDGENAVLLPSSQDHKRVFDGDKGPNTGGMGAYSPAPVVTADKLPAIKEKIILPVVRELKKRGIVYRGILYAGLMVNDANSNPRGPLAKSGSEVNVVEFNARFGDPETEAVLPRLGGSFALALLHAAKGCLKDEDIIVKDEVAATVIVAAGGYPGAYEKGKTIVGAEAEEEKTIVFHCGTKQEGEKVVTAGGRVLSVTGLGSTIREAIDRAYARLAGISFEKMFYRKDIAHRALKRIVLSIVAIAAMSLSAAKLPLSDEYAREKAESILKKMTLEQKVSLCGGCATMYLNAIPEVGIPREWGMSDCSHTLKPEHGREHWPYVNGIDDRSTSLPPLSALAQTWNPSLATLHGRVMGEQNRARNKDMMLGPGVNIARTPLCGRNWEYMSEDPFLAAKLVVPLIQAVQKEGVATTVKHFCLNNQELARTSVDTICDERTLNEIYLPAFEAAICEAGSLALMTAYNKINGQYASENAYTQRGILRDRWGFPGLIVTDWGGAHSTVQAALNGGNVEMNYGAGIIYFTDFWHQDREHPLLSAVKKGEVPEATVDEMALHVLWTMAKTGFLDGLQPAGKRLVKEHYEVCGKIGDEAIVLAKNEAGVLPLKASELKKVIMLGRAADMNQCQLGCSCEGHAPYEITPFQGLKEYLGEGVEVKLLPLGAEAMVGNDPTPIDNLLLDTFTPNSSDAFVERAWEIRAWPDGKPWKDEGKIIGYTKDPTGEEGAAIRYQARVTAPESGKYVFSFSKKVGFRAATVKVDGKRLFNCSGTGDSAGIQLEKGKIYTITLDIADGKKDSFKFGWTLPSVFEAQKGTKDEEIKAADAVIVFTGTTMGVGPAREQESGDRPDMKNPEGHDEEIAKLLKLNLKNLVIINRSCSPCELPWIDSAKTVVLKPYLGQESGRILARTLFGEVNPSGKLCITWPRRYADTGVAQCGTYNNKSVIYNERFYVGYRWYDAKAIEPLFPFGYGLSYTTFKYDQAKVEADGEIWKVSVRITNTGKVAGKETVQFYMAPRAPKIERAVKELKGFAKTRLLQPGESEVLSATLTKRDFAYWDVLCHRWRTDPGSYDILVGASSRDIRGRGVVEIKP